MESVGKSNLRQFRQTIECASHTQHQKETDEMLAFVVEPNRKQITALQRKYSEYIEIGARISSRLGITTL